MLRSLIIDDEKLSRDLLHSMLNEYCREVELVGEADSFEDATRLIDHQHPDLIFLDIEMPQKNGLELLHGLKERNFMTVFVTAFNQYAVQAIKEGATDYLLKPLDIEELRNTVTRLYTQWLKRKNNFPDKQDLDRKIIVPHFRGFKVIALKEIIRLEADNNYTFIHLTEGSPVLVSKPIKEMEEKINSEWFFRTHRSHLINLYHFKEFLREDGGYAVMRDGKTVSLSRLRIEEFFIQVGKFGSLL